MSLMTIDKPAKKARVSTSRLPKRPRPLTKKWYVQTMEGQIGPVSSRRLWKLAQQRLVRPENFVRKGDDGKWILAERIKGLFDPNFPIFGQFVEYEEQQGDGFADEETAAVELAEKMFRKDRILAAMARRQRLNKALEWSVAGLGLSLTLSGIATFLTSSQQVVSFEWGSPQYVLALCLTSGGVVVSIVGAIVLSMWAKR